MEKTAISAVTMSLRENAAPPVLLRCPAALAAGVALLLCTGMSGGQTITVNAGSVLSDVSGRPLGVNVNYLMDDDTRLRPTTSTAEALKGMKVGFLRYPGGEKSDNYLWSTSPWASPDITAARVNAWPASDTDFYSNGKDGRAALLDFDEFIALCGQVGAQPVICVCFDGMYKAASGNQVPPTKAALKQNAVEWVRYANVTKKYNVKYWTLGNETDYGDSYAGANPGASVYAADAAEFAAAMKAVDPTIKVGINGKGQTWFTTVLQKALAQVDYLEVHTYPTWDYAGYDSYRNGTVSVSGAISSATNAINALSSQADKDRLFVSLTEYNAIYWGQTAGWPNVNDLGHALAVFDITGQILCNSKVKFSMLWNTRWVDNDESGSPSINDALDKEGNLNATGKAMALWGRFLRDRMVQVSGVTTSLRAFAGTSSTGTALSVCLVNKALTQQNCTVAVQNYTGAKSGSRWTFSGTGQGDFAPVIQEKGSVSISGGTVTVALPAVSVTVLSFEFPSAAGATGRCAVPGAPAVPRAIDLQGRSSAADPGAAEKLRRVVGERKR